MKFATYLFPLSLLLSTTAHAADVLVEQAPLPVAAAYDWSGIYIGVNGGYGGGDFEHPFSVDAEVDEGVFTEILNGSLDVTASGFLGGGQIGYNWQSGQFVFGAEADIQASNIKGEVSGDISVDEASPILGGLDGNAEAGTELEYFGTVRARLGYVPVERLLVYGTGGFAYGRTESYLRAGADGGPDLVDVSTRDNRTGWTVGGGAEYAFTDNWSLKTEYLYTDLGTEELFSESIDTIAASLDSDVKFHTVRAGLNWKF
jgi:outer membrane immunogenic protein